MGDSRIQINCNKSNWVSARILRNSYKAIKEYKTEIAVMEEEKREIMRIVFIKKLEPTHRIHKRYNKLDSSIKTLQLEIKRMLQLRKEYEKEITITTC